MSKSIILMIITWVAFIASIGNAASMIYVDASGPNDPGTGSYVDPFRRIQDAINTANDGDIIEIRPGLYTGQGNYDLDPNGKSITIRSTDPNDPEVIAVTIIDPNEAGRGFYFHSGEDANCMVAGLTLRNAAAPESSGAGIYCAGDSPTSPTIRNCVIINNFAEWGGGGIYCLNSESTIRNCIIAGNTVLGTGGGIKCLLSSNFAIINCTISGNSAGWEQGGDGVYCINSTVSIKNSIIWGNFSEQVSAIGGDPVITYSDVQDGWTGTENINTDPLFVSFDPNGSPDLWDFHLQSVYGRWDPNSQSWVSDSNTSPCIDGGDPNSDWSREPWPNGKRINIGAYGGTSQASMNGNIADFDISGSVNFLDFAEFSNKWFSQEFCIEDLTKNGTVDVADLGMFAGNWLWQGP